MPGAAPAGPRMASMALSTRLTRTWWSFSGSMRTGGSPGGTSATRATARAAGWGPTVAKASSTAAATSTGRTAPSPGRA